VATSRSSLSLLPDGLGERYGLPPIVAAEPLGGGYHNVLLRSGDLVIRIEDRAPESVAWEHDLLAFLGAELEEVLQPLRAVDGSTFVVHDGRVVSLLPFVAGTRGAEGAAALLARIHVRGLKWRRGPRPDRPAYCDMDLERNDWWDWSLVPKPPELVRAFGRMRAFLRDAPPLATTTVHGDIAPQNILSRGGRIVALIDWEYARVEWAALELANAAWSLREHDVQSFVDEYRAAGGPGEPDVLDEGINVRLVANALYSLTCAAAGRAWSPEWVDHLLATLRERG
jgi:Ser/Thr protein kinase RdoA (MazF antagonist)